VTDGIDGRQTPSVGRLPPPFRPGPWLVGIALLVVGSIALGSWWLGSLKKPNDPVRIVEFFSGTLTDIDESGGSVCIAPQTGGDKRCGVIFVAPGSPRLSVGESVSIAREVMKTENPNVSRDVWVIYRPQPSSS
jgi:hypothetical protein